MSRRERSADCEVDGESLPGIDRAVGVPCGIEFDRVDGFERCRVEAIWEPSIDMRILHGPVGAEEHTYYDMPLRFVLPRLLAICRTWCVQNLNPCDARLRRRGLRARSVRASRTDAHAFARPSSLARGGVDRRRRSRLRCGSV